MMFNISIDGGSFSKNLEDFDSIRSVLLYRSVKHLNCYLHKACVCLIQPEVVGVVGRRHFVRGSLNTGGDLKTSCKSARRWK